MKKYIFTHGGVGGGGGGGGGRIESTCMQIAESARLKDGVLMLPNVEIFSRYSCWKASILKNTCSYIICSPGEGGGSPHIIV